VVNASLNWGQPSSHRVGRRVGLSSISCEELQATLAGDLRHVFFAGVGPACCVRHPVFQGWGAPHPILAVSAVLLGGHHGFLATRACVLRRVQPNRAARPLLLFDTTNGRCRDRDGWAGRQRVGPDRAPPDRPRTEPQPCRRRIAPRETVPSRTTTSFIRPSRFSPSARLFPSGPPAAAPQRRRWNAGSLPLLRVATPDPYPPCPEASPLRGNSIRVRHVSSMRAKLAQRTGCVTRTRDAFLAVRPA